MITRKSLLRNIVASAVIIVGASGVFAADAPSADHPVPTKEMREKMATLHEQMAACLRSDKPVADCRSQMMKSCRDLMGGESCPMMDMAGRRHHMMKDLPSDSSEHK